MGAESMLSVRSPLNARLDGKAFVQLTLWFVVVLAALALGRYLFGKAQKTAAGLTGAASTATGLPNPFSAVA